MKVFIALLVASLAVAAQAGHVPTSWNEWNGLNGWNGHAAYPYGVNQWSPAWPVASGRKTVVQANVAKVNPWGLPLAYGNEHSSYPYGTNYWTPSAWPVSSLHGGYNGVKTVVQANVAHQVNHWGVPLAYGNGYNNYWGAAPAVNYAVANPGLVHVAPLTGHAISHKLVVA